VRHLELETPTTKAGWRTFDANLDTAFAVWQDSVPPWIQRVLSKEIKLIDTQIIGKCENLHKRKPRSIAPSDKGAMVVLGPFYNVLEARIKKLWPIHSKPDNTFLVRYTKGQNGYKWETLPSGESPSSSCFAVVLTYLAGSTHLQKSAWFKKAHEMVGIHVCVGGDDGCIVINDGLLCTYFDGDVSNFDTSEGVAALDFELDISNACGLPADICQLMHLMMAAPSFVSLAAFERYANKMHKIPNANVVKFVWELHTRSSGQRNTTVGNSIVIGPSYVMTVLNTIAAIFDQQARLSSTKPIVERPLSALTAAMSGTHPSVTADEACAFGVQTMHGLGFTIKLFIKPKAKVTFHKCCFIPVSDHYICVPCPGLIVKMGCTKRTADELRELFEMPEADGTDLRRMWMRVFVAAFTTQPNLMPIWNTDRSHSDLVLRALGERRLEKMRKEESAGSVPELKPEDYVPYLQARYGDHAETILESIRMLSEEHWHPGVTLDADMVQCLLETDS
jgi:hypothetical protein